LARRAIEAGVHPAQIDDFGQTALHSAAANEECSAELIQLLVQNCTGTDPFDIKNCDDHTPLFVAKACGYHRVAHLFASACASKRST
jgi:ankyrin repeat protein